MVRETKSTKQNSKAIISNTAGVTGHVCEEHKRSNMYCGGFGDRGWLLHIFGQTLQTFGGGFAIMPSIMLLVSPMNSKPWKYGTMLCDHWGGVAGAGFDQPALLHDDMWSF